MGLGMRLGIRRASAARPGDPAGPGRAQAGGTGTVMCCYQPQAGSIDLASDLRLQVPWPPWASHWQMAQAADEGRRWATDVESGRLA